MRHRYEYGAVLDIGSERENQEDYVAIEELDNETLLCILADGTGSQKDHPQPGGIVAESIKEQIMEVFNNAPDLFDDDPLFFLKYAFLNANKILGGFKMGNEERYFGYAASVTACFFDRDGSIYVAHTGNTRLYVLRDGQIRQITHDMTKGAELLEDGKIDLETYYVHPARLQLTGGLGMLLEPKIETFDGRLKKNDLVVMSTDGLHYAVRKEFLPDLILTAEDSVKAAESLVTAAKSTKYPDNIGAIVVRQN